jgi:hypothetical protein
MDAEPQGELFPHETGDLVKSPLCSYGRHCGAMAELGPEEQMTPTCINRSIRCLRCGATGVRSANLEAGTKKKAQ